PCWDSALRTAPAACSLGAVATEPSGSVTSTPPPTTPEPAAAADPPSADPVAPASPSADPVAPAPVAASPAPAAPAPTGPSSVPPTAPGPEPVNAAVEALIAPPVLVSAASMPGILGAPGMPAAIACISAVGA